MNFSTLSVLEKVVVSLIAAAIMFLIKILIGRLFYSPKIIWSDLGYVMQELPEIDYSKEKVYVCSYAVSNRSFERAKDVELRISPKPLEVSTFPEVRQSLSESKRGAIVTLSAIEPRSTVFILIKSKSTFDRSIIDDVVSLGAVAEKEWQPRLVERKSVTVSGLLDKILYSTLFVFSILWLLDQLAQLE